MKLKPEGKRENVRMDSQGEPLCKFGPGGDFVSVWHPESPESSGQNCIEKLFASTIEIAAVLLGYKRINPYIPLLTGKQLLHHKEDKKNAVKFNRICHPSHTSPVRITPADSRISAEPMLFPDFSGNGCRVKHQPKHRIRTYQRTTRKRTSVRIAKQGSLFEDQFKSARIA
jgi:hypothetical protein